VAGTARTFENHVSVRLRDEEGQVIARTFTTARGELGSFNPWEVEVFMTSWPGKQVIVEAFDVSAKDGSEQSLVKVSAPLAVEPGELELYFHDAKRAPNDCSQVFAVKRRAPSSISVARLVVEALIAGPLPFEAGESNSIALPAGKPGAGHLDQRRRRNCGFQRGAAERRRVLPRAGNPRFGRKEPSRTSGNHARRDHGGRERETRAAAVRERRRVSSQE
jgi:hypothetical protein